MVPELICNFPKMTTFGHAMYSFGHEMATFGYKMYSFGQLLIAWKRSLVKALHWIIKSLVLRMHYAELSAFCVVEILVKSPHLVHI